MADTVALVAIRRSSDGRWSRDGRPKPWLWMEREPNEWMWWVGFGRLALLFGLPARTKGS